LFYLPGFYLSRLFGKRSEFHRKIGRLALAHFQRIQLRENIRNRRARIPEEIPRERVLW